MARIRHVFKTPCLVTISVRRWNSDQHMVFNMYWMNGSYDNNNNIEDFVKRKTIMYKIKLLLHFYAIYYYILCNSEITWVTNIWAKGTLGDNLSHQYSGQRTLRDEQFHFHSERINSILWKRNVLSKIVVFNSSSERIGIFKEFQETGGF